MILQLRIESKLYNGIVTVQNAHAVSAKMILLANDELAGNDLMKKSTMAQADPEFNVQIRGIQETSRLLADPRAEKLMVQIICTSPRDAAALLENLGKTEVVVGKYKAKKAENKLELNSSWVVAQEDVPYWERLYELSGGHLYGQVLSEHPKQDFLKLLQKAKKCD